MLDDQLLVWLINDAIYHGWLSPIILREWSSTATSANNHNEDSSHWLAQPHDRLGYSFINQPGNSYSRRQVQHSSPEFERCCSVTVDEYKFQTKVSSLQILNVWPLSLLSILFKCRQQRCHWVKSFDGWVIKDSEKPSLLSFTSLAYHQKDTPFQLGNIVLETGRIMFNPQQVL